MIITIVIYKQLAECPNIKSVTLTHLSTGNISEPLTTNKSVNSNIVEMILASEVSILQPQFNLVKRFSN